MTRGRARAALALTALCALAAPACECFRDPRQLGTFRVLGVRTEPLGPTPGERVTLTLVSADVRPRAVQVAWYLCPDSVVGPIDLPGFPGPSDGSSAVDDCLRAPPFATGTSATIEVPADALTRGGTGGGPDAVPRVNVVGFACAGGTIGPPPERSVWPSCQGSDAQGFLFFRTVLVRDPAVLPQAPANPELPRVTFGPREQPGAPITLDQPPRVARCANPGDPPSCARFRVQLEVQDPSGPGGPVFAGQLAYVVDRATLERVRPGGSPGSPGFRAPCPFLPEFDASAGFEWMPPSEPGEVRFYFFYASALTGGFAWTERRVVVE